MPDFTPIVLSGPSVDVNATISDKSQSSRLKLHFTQTQFTQAPTTTVKKIQFIANTQNSKGDSLICDENMDSLTPTPKKVSQEV